MRIRGAKTELADAGLETEGMAESTAKLREEIMALSGVDIMLDKNTFKSTYQIMEELAGKWEQLTDIQQASVTELIAGKRQGNIVSSLMTNFDIAEDALQTSLNSQGSAMREHEKWMESLQAKLNELKAAWQAFSQAFLSSDLLKGGLNVLINLLEILTKIIDKLGTIPAILAGVGLFKLGKKGLGSLFGVKQTEVDILVQIAEAMGLVGVNSGKSAGLLGRFKGALKGVTGEASGAKGAIGGLFKALSNPYVLAAVVAITAVTAAIMYQKKKAEELSEEVDELTSKYQEQHSALMQSKSDFDTSNANSLASRYKELSKGVDGLGRNISLTADEYSEYQSVCNEIAEQVPSLVSGYDEQGNAILNCKGNVEQLTEAYQKLIHAQNQDILTNAGDIEKDFANELEKQSGEHWWSNGHGFWAGLWNSTFSGGGSLFKSAVDYELKDDTVKGLQDWLNATNKKDKNKALRQLKTDRYSGEEIRDALNAAGFEVGAFDNVWKELEKAYKKDPQKIKGIIDNYSAQFDELVNQQKTIAQAKLSEAFDVDSAISGMDYSGISENLQAVAHSVVNSFDYDFLTELSEQGKTVESWVTDMLNQLNAISDADSAEIDAAFNLQTKFNNNDISYGGYIDQIRDISSVIDNLNVSDEVKSQIRLALNTEEVIEQYDALSKKLTSEKYDIQLETKEAEAFLDSLTSEELSVLTQIIPELSKNGVNETVDDLRAEIEKAMAMNPPTIDIAVETERLEVLTSAITESLSGVGLSGEATTAIESMFSNLGSYDASKLFERTANGIRLNSDELRRLNNEYADTNMSALNNKMSDLGDLYNETQLELAGLTYGTDEYNDKVGELSAIEAQINSVETLATQYKGLTSAYNQWQQAEAAGQQRDMYESVIEGLENIDDEISRGWVDDATVEFLELLSGQDLSTAGIDKIKKAYQGLDKTIKNTSYSVRDFFTVDDEGNSTNAGVYNFLDAVGQLEEEKFGGKDIVKRDKKGNIISFDFKTAGGDEVIAEALGVSEELVQIMVRAADDAGFVVSMDGTYQQLDVLKEKAQEAAESLKRIMGKNGVDFNFNANTIEEITPQLKEAEKILDRFRNKDGSINLEMEGAEEAFTVASTLQSMLDKLTRPAYMEIQTSQVDKELQKPLENLQEYRRLVETEHQLKLSGADTSELEKSKSDILDYFEDIQANNPELAVELGIDGDSRKELEKKISEGKFEIPATVDIQMEMDDKLGILVDKALLDAGIIGKKEFKKRVDIYLDADVDNKDAKSKTEKATKEVAGESSGKDGKSSGKKKVKKNVDVEVKADKVDTSDVKKKTEKAVKKDVPTGADGKKAGMGIDVEVKAEKVDTSDVDKKAKEAVEKVSKEKSKVDKEVELEVTADEYRELIQDLENVDKDIVIDVTVKGLDDVEKLNKNIDLATKIDGDIDNLSEFVKGAKELSKLDNNIEADVTANVYGNVLDTREGKLDNIKVFADSAKPLSKAGIGYVEAEVTANVYGNVTGKKEKGIDNLKVFAESAKPLVDAGIGADVNASVTANVYGNVTKKKEKAIDNLSLFAEEARKLKDSGLTGFSVSVTADVHGNVIKKKEKAIDNLSLFAEQVKDLNKVKDKGMSITVSADVHGNVIKKKEKAIDNLSLFAEQVEELNKVKGKGVSVTASADIDGDVIKKDKKSLENISVFAEQVKKLNEVKDKGISVTASAEIGGNVVKKNSSDLENIGVFADQVEKLKDVEGKSVTASAEIDGNVIKKDKSALENIGVFADQVNALKDVEGKSVSAYAEIKGNVDDKNKKELKNIGVFAEQVEELNKVKGKGVSVTASATIKGNVDDKSKKELKNLSLFAEQVEALNTVKGKGISVTATADIKGSVIEKSGKELKRLGIFAEQVPKLADVEGKSVTASAEIRGNVIDKSKKELQRIGVFADEVSKLADVEGVSVTASARIDGNVDDKSKKELQNIGVFATEAKKLVGVEGKSVTVSADIRGNVAGKDGSEKVANLKKFITNASGLSDIGTQEASATANISGNIAAADGESKISRLKSFNSIANALKSVGKVVVSVTANIATDAINGAITLLEKVVDSGLFKNHSASVKVTASVDSTAVDNYIAVPKTANGKVKWGNNAAAVNEFKKQVHEATGKVNWKNNTEKVKKKFTAQGTVTWTSGNNVKVKVVKLAKGTAYSEGSALSSGTSGRAFAHGDWGIKGNGVALGGEVAPEIVVRQGKWFTIGDQGAEFFQYKKNDIVFNATQTAALLKYGGLKGADPRGKVLAGGTAFAEGKAFAGSSGSGGVGKVGSNKVTGKSYASSSSKSSSSDADKFEETIDWIEVAIDRIERAIDQLDTKANSVYRTWSERNSNLVNEISKVEDEIALQQKAYDKYIAAANAVGLSSSYAKKVREGTINIQTIKNETLAEKIKDYQEWYEKALDCKDAILELQEAESELYQQRFENVSKQYEGILSIVEHEKNMLEEFISQSEANAQLTSSKYYDALIKNEQTTISKLQSEKSALLSQLNTAVASGKIKKESEAWYEMVNSIDEVTLAIEESNTAILEYQQTLQQLSWEVFDLLQDKISSVSEEAEFLIELLSNDKLYDDKGKLTNSGSATMGLHGQNYNTYMYQADKYAEEVAKLNREIKKDPYDQDLINRRDELLELQRESILAAQDEKEAIRDLVNEGIELELDSLSELIDKYNEALDSEKD